MPLIGKKLPDFELKAYHDEAFITIKSADYRGKWLILFFYPADFTFVCPTELGDLTNYYPEFQDKGAEILSVSTDTQFVHKAWHDGSETIKKIKFPMLADTTGELSRALGVYIPEEGLAYRASFVIDPDGIIKAYEVHDNSIGRSAAELLRKLQAAKFVREHGGEVCPANWKPGEKTLEPGIDLVGKL
ncbi:MAG: alkyl hydroperoxide reductase subunit C [Patescibacteria group bacterium]